MKNIYSNFFKTLEEIFPSDKYFINNYEEGKTLVCSLDGNKLLQEFKFYIKESDNLNSLQCIFNSKEKTIFTQTKNKSINIWLDISALTKWITQNCKR